MLKSFSLSIEEVAFALAAAGDSDGAAGFLQSLVGNLSPDQLSGRLTAASHSLLARGILTIDLSNQQSSMSTDLARIVSVFTNATSSIRCTKTVNAGEMTVTYFFDRDGCLEYVVEQGVVSHLTLFDAHTDVLSRIIDFVECRKSGRAQVWGKVSGESLQIMRRMASERDETRLKQHIQQRLDHAAVDALATSMLDGQAIWGAVLLLTTTSTSPEIEANKGIFYLNTRDTTWLFDATGNDAMLTVAESSIQMLTDSVQRLLKQAGNQ